MSTSRHSHYNSPLLLDILTALPDAGDRASLMRTMDDWGKLPEDWHLASYPLKHDNSEEPKDLAMGAATSTHMSPM